jgi:hypothetical protein
MPGSQHARSGRLPLHRRLEMLVQYAAVIFFVVLGLAIGKEVSQRTPTSAGPPRSSDVLPNNVGPSREVPSVTGSNTPAPGNAAPSEKKPSKEGPAVAESNSPLPGIRTPSESKPSEDEPSATGTIESVPKAASPSPAPLDCARGSPTYWQFANVDFIDSSSARALSPVASCRLRPAMSGPLLCQDVVIIGLGVASSKGIDAIESARAMQRGVNLVSALKKDLQARCSKSVSVSAYVLNLGRYSDEPQRDEPDQRKVIALVSATTEDADKAATDAVAGYAKSEPKISHYPICALYKLDGTNRPVAIPTERKICGDQSARVVSQR